MARDFDARRTGDGEEEEAQEESLESLKARTVPSGEHLGDDVDALETELDLPDLDMPQEDLTVRVMPRRADEFTCTRCFLVHHRSQLADSGRAVCTDCAA